MKAEIVKFGTMYFDGSPADPGARFDKKTLSIGGTLPGWELPWVKDGDRLIADRCICTTVSWHQLDCWGFVFGKLVYIDRNPYVCRCLRVGNTEEEPCEWTELMDKYGDDDGLWHWDGRFFWGQEATWKDGAAELECATRGFHSAHDWYSFDSRKQLHFVGFRPVLEPLSSEPPDAFVGKTIRVYGQAGGYVSGILIGLDDYDLVLKPDGPMLDKRGWAVQQGEEFIVQRNAVLGIYNKGK